MSGSFGFWSPRAFCDIYFLGAILVCGPPTDLSLFVCMFVCLYVSLLFVIMCCGTLLSSGKKWQN